MNRALAARGAVRRHFARIGGVMIRPGRTFSEMLRSGRGDFLEVLIWMPVVASAAVPTRAGTVLLVARTDPVTGVRLFLNMIADRMIFAWIGALVAGIVIFLVSTARASEKEDGITYFRATDLCAFALVPFLALMSLGALLHALGLELWFMPHRQLGGRGYVLAVRILVGYGWSLALVGLIVIKVWRKDRGTSAGNGDRAATG